MHCGLVDSYLLSDIPSVCFDRSNSARTRKHLVQRCPCCVHSNSSTHWNSLLLVLEHHVAAARQNPAWSGEMARVTVGITLQVVLVLRLGFPKRTRRGDLCDDLAGPES